MSKLMKKTEVTTTFQFRFRIFSAKSIRNIEISNMGKSRRHRTPERKSSKYRNRSDSSSNSSSSSRCKSSLKYKTKRQKRRDSRSRSPSIHRSRQRRRATSSSDSSSSISMESRKPSSLYVDRIRAIRTPTPPKLNFEASMQFLDKRQITDALSEINANEFRPKTFSSVNNTNVKQEMIDLIIKGEAKIQKIDAGDDPLFHQNVFGDDDNRMEKWVHRFNNYRQKRFASIN
ncbi:uncharacterized protein LOC116349966 isoform X2 [Contarinia nasturtii]|uniref:uncharacterized protein LOC116349966 isoform X2 n=1 Tax=Contarinia nasturtii TaxID=265458 RepID=UPI0012D4B6BB|nr:uncharacterized protein LOC116349966 isoform X2 [Contarinia nasturtii]